MIMLVVATVQAGLLAYVAVTATRDLPFLAALAIVAVGALILRIGFRVSGVDAWFNRLWNGGDSAKSR